MEKINKRDIILIVSIILIVAIVAVIIIIPKDGNRNNETINNNSGDVVANSPASPEELFSRPINTNTLTVSNEVPSGNDIQNPSNQGIRGENSDLGEIVNTTLQ